MNWHHRFAASQSRYGCRLVVVFAKMLHVMIFGANLRTAAQQAGAVSCFLLSLCVCLLCVLFRFNHQLLFTLGWLKSAAVLIRWQLLTLNLLTNWQLCENNEWRSRGKKWMGNITNVVFSDCSGAHHLSPVSSVNVKRSALSFVCLPRLVCAPVDRVIYMHFTALCFTLCSQISLTTTFLLMCWKFSVDW